MQSLKLYPFTEKSSDFSSILVEYVFTENLLRLNFHLPLGMESRDCCELVERADGLWERTCFECFISYGDGSYDEWNFSLTGQWQNYFFDSYRDPQPPHLGKVDLNEVEYLLRGRQLYLELPLKGEAHAFNPCVIIKGNTFFAASHGKAKADFHDLNTFILL